MRSYETPIAETFPEMVLHCVKCGTRFVSLHRWSRVTCGEACYRAVVDERRILKRALQRYWRDVGAA